LALRVIIRGVGVRLAPTPKCCWRR
jgi:hypothetical protein